MTLASVWGQRASIENPAVPISAASFAPLWGGRRAGVPHVDEQRALGISAYYRGIALLSGTKAKLPLKVYRKGSKERVRQVTVLDRPNPRDTPFAFWQTIFANAIPWGNAYALKVRNGASVVTQLWPVHPSRVRVEAVEPSPANEEGKLFLYRDAKGAERRMSTWQMLHIPYLAVDGTTGVSPLKLCGQLLGGAVAAEEYAGRFFTQSSTPGGALTTDADLSSDQALFLQDQWESRHSGLDGAHRIAILDNGAKFQPITIPPEDAQLLQTRMFSVTEIARLLGMPPHLLGDMEKSTSWGSGIEQQTNGLMVFNLDQWLTLTEQIVTAEVLPGGLTSGAWYAEWAREGLLQGDSAARAAFYKSGLEVGWMSRNEVRGRENLEPVEGGDSFMLPSNYTLIGPDGSMTPLAAAGVNNSKGGA